ncbi:MAG: LysM peptidoglycan-binding domain-containing protein [Deltaproteobacteria bacterium]|nr:LysM peptidoglycan-binding domain-containing protein [Deltaproteobacteria bacterium]
MKSYNQTIKNLLFLCVILLPVFAFPRVSLPEEKTEEETYAISLVQTAEEGKEILELEDKKVLAETYTIRKNDHVWQLLRERDLLKKHNLSEILATLKKLNRSFTNLDLIYPGQKIVIPLVITPLDGEPQVAEETIESPIETPIEASGEVPVPLAEIKDLDLEHYTIEPDDTLIRVINSRYDISEKELSDYLQLVKRLNPSIRDLDLVHPGQRVKLPVWSPQTVKVPILAPPPAPPSSSGDVERKREMAVMGRRLGEIFDQMGEEWVQTGDHFIPLQSGGHMNLKTESFPILNLFNGHRVIVDLNDELPENMASLIESNWETYRIIHLGKDDDLGMAFHRILSVCPYAKIYTLGEPLELGGDIPLRITGDWIIKPTPEPTDKKEMMTVINLLDEQTPKTSQTIKDYLDGLGVKVIDYPSGSDDKPSSGAGMEILSSGGNISSLVEIILTKTGQSFSRDVEIPIVKGGDTGFNLTIRADFFLKISGQDAMIDLEGIGPDMIALLEEHQLKILSLAGKEDFYSILRDTLGFLGVPYDSSPHDFMASERDEQKNIRLTIRGIVFKDKDGQNILATHLNIPEEIAVFLSQRGYHLLRLSSS